jgi:hypothetical protein
MTCGALTLSALISSTSARSGRQADGCAGAVTTKCRVVMSQNLAIL